MGVREGRGTSQVAVMFHRSGVTATRAALSWHTRRAECRKNRLEVAEVGKDVCSARGTELLSAISGSDSNERKLQLSGRLQIPRGVANENDSLVVRFGPGDALNCTTHDADSLLRIVCACER